MESILETIVNRRSAGYIAAFAGIAALTAIGAPLHDYLNDTTVALALLLMVLIVSTVWGRGPGIVASVFGMLCFNFFFLPPLYTFCLLYTSDAADERSSVDLGGR